MGLTFLDVNVEFALKEMGAKRYWEPVMELYNQKVFYPINARCYKG